MAVRPGECRSAVYSARMSALREREIPDALAPPPGNPRFPLLDSLRGVAALCVVILHALLLTGSEDDGAGRLFVHLGAGVPIFFLLTGFLLYRPLFASSLGLAPPMATRAFYWRRLLRIVPAYWVALIVLAPALTFASLKGLPNFAFLQIYRTGWARTGIPPGWTVCVELSFYLLLPLYAWMTHRRWAHHPLPLRRRRELQLLALLAALSLVFRVGVQAAGLQTYAVDPLPGTFAWFAIGMALAVTSVQPGALGERLRRAAQQRAGLFWAGAATVYAATTAYSGRSGVEGSLLTFCAYGAIAFLVVVPAVFAQPASEALPARVLRLRALAWLGLVSYGVYLYHFPLLEQLGVRSFPLLALAGVAVSVTAGALSYYVVERQVLKLKSRVPA
jgi:peptidoglycan/LPS O-acetylase OafA/YrhL